MDLQPSTIAVVLAALIILIYMYLSIERVEKRERQLLEKIKKDLLPTIIQNLEELEDKLQNIQQTIQQKENLTQILRRNVSYALLIDFKKHFYETGTEIIELQKQLQQLDSQIERLKEPTQQIIQKAKQLKEKIGQLKDKLQQLQEHQKYCREKEHSNDLDPINYKTQRINYQ